MPKITLKQAINLRIGNDLFPLRRGINNVTDEVANHWYVKAHTEEPKRRGGIPGRVPPAAAAPSVEDTHLLKREEFEAFMEESRLLREENDRLKVLLAGAKVAEASPVEPVPSTDNPQSEATASVEQGAATNPESDTGTTASPTAAEPGQAASTATGAQAPTVGAPTTGRRRG